MSWELDAATTIAALALAVSAATFVRGELRERRTARDLDRGRLGLSAQRLGDGALLVEISYRPPAEHTRYTATLTAMKPVGALLSEPGWKDSSTPHVFIAAPSPTFDPSAQQRRMATVELTDHWRFARDGALAVGIVAHAPGGLRALTLEIKIQDVATGAKVLTARETLTA